METNTNKISITLQTGLISQVFTFMGAALLISGVLAYAIANNPSLLQLMYPAEGGVSILGYVIMFSPLIFTLVMSGVFQRFSARTLMVLVIAFSACMEASLGSLF